MKLQEEMIRMWVSDPDLSLEDMYDNATENDMTNYLVERRETLENYIIDRIKQCFKVAPLLASIENNTWADFFVFDVTGWSNNPAKPIYTKEELAQVLDWGIVA